MTADDVTVSFQPAGGAHFTTNIQWGSRRFGLDISQYPELVEFRAMLEAEGDRPWMGRHYAMAVDDEVSGTHRVSPMRRQMYFDVSATEWTALRDLFRRAWQRPELQSWLAELQLEYGEQG